MTGLRRALGRTARLATATGVAALGGSCIGFGPSELDVHNRTTVAIQWTELNRTNGLLACGSATFIWNAG